MTKFVPEISVSGKLYNNHHSLSDGLSVKEFGETPLPHEAWRSDQANAGLGGGNAPPSINQSSCSQGQG